jgi:hypothetical protein
LRAVWISFFVGFSGTTAAGSVVWGAMAAFWELPLGISIVELNGAFGDEADVSEWLEAEETADAVVSVFCLQAAFLLFCNRPTKKICREHQTVFMTPPMQEV